MPTSKDPSNPAEKLRQKIAALQAKLKKQEAATKNKERKLDTRRCILAGRYILKHADLNPADPLSRKLAALLDEYLVPDRTHSVAMINADRALFEGLGLKPLAPEAPANQAGEAGIPSLTSEFPKSSTAKPGAA